MPSRAFCLFIFAITSVTWSRGFIQDDAGCVPRGSVRITDGLTPKLGRVEVCLSSGTWSRIDARSFDNATAKVVCSQVGHAKYGAIPFDTTFFRPSRTPTIIKSIRCLGTESSIAQCSQEYYSEAQNVSDAGIYCPFVSSNCTDGSVRLVNGVDAKTGKLEICVEGVYGGVCNEHWTKSGSEVICKQLGLSSTNSTSFNWGPIVLGSSLAFSVSCTGIEKAVNRCSIRPAPSMGCTDAAGVRCIGADQCAHGAVRLADGDGPNEGRVELCIRGKWGSVCDDYWDNAAAKVVCRQLGFQHQEALALSNAAYGVGSLGVVLGKVRCDGGETSILGCRLDELGHSDCSPNEAAGLVCRANATVCKDGDVRLLGGRSTNEGRVEVCVGNLYGAVCDQSWSNADAAVVCSQLGFSRRGAIAAPKLSFGVGKGVIHLTEVDCTGSESSLSRCRSKRGSNDICPHYRDAGVICPGLRQGPNADTPLMPLDGIKIFNSEAQSHNILSVTLHHGVSLHPGITLHHGALLHPRSTLHHSVTLHPGVISHQTQLGINRTSSSVATHFPTSTPDKPMLNIKVSSFMSSEDIAHKAAFTQSKEQNSPKATPSPDEDLGALTTFTQDKDQNDSMTTPSPDEDLGTLTTFTRGKDQNGSMATPSPGEDLGALTTFTQGKDQNNSMTTPSPSEDLGALTTFTQGKDQNGSMATPSPSEDLGTPTTFTQGKDQNSSMATPSPGEDLGALTTFTQGKDQNDSMTTPSPGEDLGALTTFTQGKDQNDSMTTPSPSEDLGALTTFTQGKDQNGSVATTSPSKDLGTPTTFTQGRDQNGSMATPSPPSPSKDLGTLTTFTQGRDQNGSVATPSPSEDLGTPTTFTQGKDQNGSMATPSPSKDLGTLTTFTQGKDQNGSMATPSPSKDLGTLTIFTQGKDQNGSMATPSPSEDLGTFTQGKDQNGSMATPSPSKDLGALTIFTQGKDQNGSMATPSPSEDLGTFTQGKDQNGSMATPSPSKDLGALTIFTQSESPGGPKVMSTAFKGAAKITPTLSDDQNVSEVTLTSMNDQGTLKVTLTLSGNQDVLEITLPSIGGQHAPKVDFTSSAHHKVPVVTPNPPFHFRHRVSDAASTHAVIFVTGLSVLISAIVFY
ncbi:hypothetical protein EMCRGX_G033248 [Ephydatia muelleri]